uniref:Uncharacterized protein n=1 Tax=Cacopsylla melanoneura TaxID=428564 RepID=A0A8D8ZBR2_9HEMI
MSRFSNAESSVRIVEYCFFEQQFKEISCRGCTFQMSRFSHAESSVRYNDSMSIAFLISNSKRFRVPTFRMNRFLQAASINDGQNESNWIGPCYLFRSDRIMLFHSIRSFVC